MAVKRETLAGIVEALDKQSNLERVYEFVENYGPEGIVAISFETESHSDDQGGSYEVLSASIGYLEDGSEVYEFKATPLALERATQEWEACPKLCYPRKYWSLEEWLKRAADEDSVYDKIPAEVADYGKIDLVNRFVPPNLEEYTLLHNGEPVE